ncbi:TPA: DUF3604 domain-containing protein [Candidatus Bathyarchaeota archaeon]|nr:DUF3604 domain-containing protein [Candidatus Bathyarchaeota archaeon]
MVNLESIPWKSINFKTGHEGRVGNFSFTQDKKGRIWVAFDNFKEGKEKVIVRYWDGRKLSPPQQIASETSCCKPQITSYLDGVALVWCSKRKNQWGLYCKIFDGEKWSEKIKINRKNEDALSPSLGTNGDDLWLAWEAHKGRVSAIRAVTFKQDKPQRKIKVSKGMTYSYRPAVSVSKEGDVYIVWDSYFKGTYNVFLRVYREGEWREIYRVSSDYRWEFMSSVTLDSSQRPWITWLCLTDVANADGVIDQWPTIRCTCFEKGCHKVKVEASRDLVSLCHGLLPKVYPSKTSVWGYLGRRRKPMIMMDIKGSIWLLWERKEIHDGSTIKTTGLLCAKRFEDEKWSEEVVLHRGHLLYTLPTYMLRSKNEIWVCTRGGLETLGDLHILWREWIDVKECPVFKSDKWLGWRFINLNKKRKMKIRRKVRVRGVEYKLYWGDIHCHSALSADAEGELDELIFYARDKANLDFCAITDNDCYILPMSNSEWFLAQHYSKKFNSSRRFVIFSGYEWSSRNGNGLPYNHRTILYHTDDQPIFRWIEPSSKKIEDLCRCIENTNGIMSAHHQKWKLCKSERERNVEVCSGWAVYIDDPKWIHKHLNRGYKFGFIGGSDSHRRNPGLCGALTGVYARSFTRKDIFEAMKNRRVYATNGSRIFLDFRINDSFIGEECQTTQSPKIKVTVEATKSPVKVDIYRNGEIIYTSTDPGRKIHVRFIDKECPRGECSYYYVMVLQNNRVPEYPSNVAVAEGNRAWSSPIWVYR